MQEKIENNNQSRREDTDTYLILSRDSSALALILYISNLFHAHKRHKKMG